MRHMRIDDLSHPQARRLLEEHLANMYKLLPPEQVFMLAITKLRASEINIKAYKSLFSLFPRLFEASKPINPCAICS